MKNPAKEYLEELGFLRRAISSIERRIAELDDKNTSLSSVRYDKLNVQTSYRNQLEDGVIRKVDEENSKRLENLKRRFEIKQEIVMLQISTMEKPLHKKILLLRYVDEMPISRIALNLHYSRDTIANEHGKALQEFRAKYLSDTEETGDEP